MRDEQDVPVDYSSLILHPSSAGDVRERTQSLNRLSDPVEPVIVPGVDCHTRGGTDAQRIAGGSWG